jgi:hypothetical protein
MTAYNVYAVMAWIAFTKMQEIWKERGRRALTGFFFT